MQQLIGEGIYLSLQCLDAELTANKEQLMAASRNTLYMRDAHLLFSYTHI